MFDFTYYSKYPKGAWIKLLILLKKIEREGPLDSDFGICGNIMLFDDNYLFSHYLFSHSHSMFQLIFNSLGYKDLNTPIPYPRGDKWSGEAGEERRKLLVQVITVIKYYLKWEKEL